jgi:ABC-2 type transport system ATP-binding protein
MLKISHITKNFDRVQALQDINLEIDHGEFFGLLGPNGAGKSTLMNVIIGYLKPDAGQISHNGKDLVFDDVNWRRRIGYVPQDIALYLELSALQNLRIFGQLYGLDSKTLNKKMGEVLELVQLTDRKKDVVKEFSGGMKRRLNIAVSLLHEPEIILCDEPTVGVDPQSRNAIFNMLIELNKSGKTIVYTTHYMEEAERMCSRLAVIDYGKIIAQGTLTELINMLNQKETVKIQKNPLVNGNIMLLQEIGRISEFDFYYELMPAENYKRASQIYSRLEEIGIPDEFVQISRATLEDVFLNLTGRSLRD